MESSSAVLRASLSGLVTVSTSQEGDTLQVASVLGWRHRSSHAVAQQFAIPGASGQEYAAWRQKRKLVPLRQDPRRRKQMTKYTFVVLTNAVEGKDDAFDEWYTNTHLGDVLAVPGFVSAQRFKLTDAQRAKPPHPFRYLALYEIETNDLQKTLDELGKRSGTPAMVLTDTMAPGTQAHIYEAITPVVTPKH
jgi:hypothetical protein